MEKFPHLNFIRKVDGAPRFPSNIGTHEKSRYNKENRPVHSRYLTKKTSAVKNSWVQDYNIREENDLAPLDKDIIPIFLQINEDLLNNLNLDFGSFGIEIISEEKDGFIVGASTDGLKSLEEKIKGFIESGHGTAKIADLWEIVEGAREDWKPQHILSEELYSKWAEISDDETFKLEVSIAFDKPIGKEPDPNKQGGEKRLADYRQKLIERDDQLMAREEHFAEFINHYGDITSSLVNLEDSFACEVEIIGKGLKDLVINYPYVFEVIEKEEVGGLNGADTEFPDFELEIIPPDDDSPEIVVIDSGIMENHKFIASAIDGTKSKSYVGGSTADHVQGGGHGTKVAGAILYPNGITNQISPYQLPFFIRNIRVLDSNNKLVNNFPAGLMVDIVEDNEDCKIFNLSINSKSPFRKKHMSSWAASIDNLTHNNNALFIISAGNISRADIRHYILNAVHYPDYQNEPNCKIANPGQSSFALTVGSINHVAFDDAFWVSLGGEFDISAFSRTGVGIWGGIKPDVVEFGGGLVKSKNGLNQINENNDTSVELLRSTLHGGGAYGTDSTGTSFSAPKVTHIVAQLKKLYPDENINLIRALVAQGARLPNEHFKNPTTQSINFFGYGMPLLERVTKNTEHRITFYNIGNISASEGHIYSLQIPDDIRNQANEFDVLIEISLSYTAKVRRTRQKTKSYLSTWLDWSSSYFDEPLDDFSKRALREIDGEKTVYEKGDNGVVQWKIRENKDWGDVKEINRNNSTLQKDWTIIKAYQLSDEISFAVRAHKGWDKNFEEVPYAIVVSLEVLNANIPIYESIRIENEIELPIEV